MIEVIEMDKSRDVRPRGSRFSRQQIKQSGHKLLTEGGNFVGSLEKSKKERIKRLSAVNNCSSSSINKRSCSNEEKEKCEMGGGDCDVSDKELVQVLASTSNRTSSTSSKRFKLPRKFFDECNGVDHASVPRKLRSAMKKRNRESIFPPFPDSKKRNHSNGEVESSKRDGLKKAMLNKQGGQDWSSKQSDCGPITKDEEEVVETLYALAGMFPYNEPKNESNTLDAPLDASPSAMPELRRIPSPALEATKEDLNSISLSGTDKAAKERSHEETAKVIPLDEQSIHEKPNLPSSNKQQGELSSSVAQEILPCVLAQQEELKPLCNSVDVYLAPERYQDTVQVKQSAKLKILPLEIKPGISLGLMTATGRRLDQQHTIGVAKSNALWPGLSSTASSGACNHGSSLQSSATTIPSWMDTVQSAARPGSLRNGSSIVKVSRVHPDRRSWKRCASHVYISRFIWNLQIPESKDRSLLHPNQLKPHDILKQGVFLTINDLSGIGNGLNGVKNASSIANTAEKNSNQVGISILQHQRLHQDQPQTSLASGVYNSQKQAFNFLSLSTGGDGLEGDNGCNVVGNRAEQLAQMKFPCLDSRVRHASLVPFSMSQTRYTPSSYPSQPAASSATSSYHPNQPAASLAQQAQLQLPPYFGNMYYGTHTSPTGTTKLQQKQHYQQRQQQQHRHWARQLTAAQYRTAGNTTTMTEFPIWQNGRQDSHTLISCAQTIVPSSSPEALGPKYPQISQQQQHQLQPQLQQLMTVTASLPQARVRRQDHLSSMYEENGGGFLAGGALPLQLLCNERL